jgi:hypothetical protein
MPPVAADLRLSAQRALLGAIYPEVRMANVRRDGSRIIFTAICEKPFSDDALDALTIAVSEIVADFPDCELDESIVGSNDPLPQLATPLQTLSVLGGARQSAGSTPSYGQLVYVVTIYSLGHTRRCSQRPQGWPICVVHCAARAFDPKRSSVSVTR